MILKKNTQYLKLVKKGLLLGDESEAYDILQRKY